MTDLQCAASAQYRPPSVYTTNVLPGQQFVASDPVSSPSVPIAAAPAAESYNAAPISSSASVSVPTGIPTSAGYSDLDPAVRGSLAAAPASGAERPSIPAPHRLNSQTGVATDAFFPSNETAASSEAASAVPEDAVGDPSGPNGAPPYLGSGNGQLDQEGLALKVSPAPASELAAHTAVVGSGGAPVPPHSAPSTTASSGRTEEPNLTPRYEHPLALQQLSPDQQQQHQHQYSTSQAQTQLGTPQSYPAQQAQVQGHYLPRIQAPQTYHLKQSSAYGADDNQSAYYDSYQHHTPSITQTLRNIHGQAPNFSANPAYLAQQSNYQPGTFQNSSSYQNALQGISSPADEPSAGRRPSAGSQRPQSVKKSSSGFFGRMSKLFRTDIRDASEASQSANRRESREPESHGAPDVDSSDEEADAATAYDQARTRTAAASGDGWHTRTDSNLRSIKGVPGGRSLISRASNALGREEDSSSDEEPETAVHVNGQYASDAASARTGKRSLLSRMSGRGSQNGTAGTRDDTNETQRIVPGPMSLRQHEAEVQRRARDSVVGAGIGQQPAPPKPEGSLVRSASTPAGSAVKRKVVKKKVVKRPVSRAESDLEGVKTSPVKRASSSAAKPLRTLTLIGDASTGTRNSRISAAGHGSASGHSSSVAPLASGKYATSNWVSTSKDVQLAPKASQHKARTRTSAGHAPPQSGGQGEGSKSHQPDELDREKTPRPRPGSTASRPASRANRALSATPTASTDPPLVVTAPPRAKDLLNAPSYSGPRASTYVTPTTAGITALRSGADVNAAGQPNYLTHYDPPMEQARAGTATPTAGTRKVVRKVKRVKSAAGAMSAPTTPIPQDSPVKVKRHVSLSARPTSAVGTGKHLPTAHDARPLSPAIKSPTPYDDEGVTRRKSVRMAPDTKLATEPRTVKVVKKVKKSAAGAKAAPAELSPVPFQVTAPKSSIVRSAQPPPIAMAPSLHSSTAASAPTRPASAPGQGFIARAPGSSLSGMGFIPSAPGSSVVSPSAIANPGRTAALPRQPARGSATQNERPRPASSAGWATRIGRDDSSDDEAPVTPDGDEYARARRAFSSASRHLGMATKRGGPVHPSQVRAV